MSMAVYRMKAIDLVVVPPVTEEPRQQRSGFLKNRELLDYPIRLGNRMTNRYKTDLQLAATRLDSLVQASGGRERP